MKTLLLHPDDSARRGPWTSKKWDLIVDLGKSTEETAAAWQRLYGCPVVRLQSFREGEDPRAAGERLRSHFGRLIDSAGIDWWELTSLYVHAELETAMAMRRLLAGADLNGEFFCSRAEWPVSGFAALHGTDLRPLSRVAQGKVTGRVRHYARALGRLKVSQALDIAWDKYDPGYRWRSRFRRREERRSTSVVLVPSAYTNVSRSASGYAALVPEQNFLLVATRRSALSFERVANLSISHLAEYAGSVQGDDEYAQLMGGWSAFREELVNVPELALLNRSGVLEPVAKWLRTGLAIRDAWRAVLEREPVSAVFCGDDSNWHTRLPVLLARKLGLPTLDFHHGALDGRFLLKTLSSEFYLAKTEMERDYLTRVCRVPSERVLLGGGEPVEAINRASGADRRPHILFFSEPYESAGARPEEVYRELLPSLSRIAADHGRTLIIKLHPFENAQERRRLMEAALGSLAGAVKLVGGALLPTLVESAWFGITVESSTVLDCTKRGVPCFHCPWFGLTPYGYGAQFARFGIGHALRSPGELALIPQMLEEWLGRSEDKVRQRIDRTPEILRQVFAGRAVHAPSLQNQHRTE